jgi:ABC-type molybdate transport system substrate-binding protein
MSSPYLINTLTNRTSRSARGSVQVANMIIDGLRTPDFVSAGTVPIKRLMNNTILFVDCLVKFGPAEIVIACFPTYRFFDDIDKARKGV